MYCMQLLCHTQVTRNNIKGCENLRFRAQKTLAEELNTPCLIRILKLLYFPFQINHLVKTFNQELNTPCLALISIISLTMNEEEAS